MKTIFVFVATLASAYACAEDCSRIIEFSKVIHDDTLSQSSVQANANAFCNEYSKNTASNSSSNFGGSYATWAVSLGMSGADSASMASRYCSAANSGQANSDAYRSYVQTIAPGAFEAYEQCKRFSDQDITFDLSPKALLPKEFVIVAHFISSSGGVTSTDLSYASSGDVNCSWDGGRGPVKRLPTGNQTTLKCRREDASVSSFVSISRSNGPGGPMTLGWGPYDKNGFRLDLLATIQNQITTLQNQVKVISTTLASVASQSGVFSIKANGTRELSDNTRCDSVDPYRGEMNGRVDFPTPFATPPQVLVGISSLDLTDSRKYAGDAVRLTVAVKQVDSKGFNYTFNTWCFTVVNGATASWIAVSR